MEKDGGEFCNKVNNFYLVGEKFSGVFDAERAVYRKEDYYWKGKGIIKNQETGDIQEFLFQTIARKEPHCLEDGLISFMVSFDSGPETIGVSWTAVHDEMYREAVDLSLRVMYEHAKKERKNYSPPTIVPAPLRGKVENGKLIA